MSKPAQKIVRTGQWLYDEAVWRPVHVVRMNYDFWYEIAKVHDQLEPGEQPDLNADGFCYYLLYSNPGPKPWWPNESGGHSVAEAMRRAEAALPSTVVWTEEP